MLKNEFDNAAEESRESLERRVNRRLEKATKNLEEKILRHARKNPDKDAITFSIKQLGSCNWRNLPAYKKIHEICAALDVNVNVFPVVDSWGHHSGLLSINLKEPYSKTFDTGMLPPQPAPAQKKAAEDHAATLARQAELRKKARRAPSF